MSSRKTEQNKNSLFASMYMHDCILAQMQWQTGMCPILFKVAMKWNTDVRRWLHSLMCLVCCSYDWDEQQRELAQVPLFLGECGNCCVKCSWCNTAQISTRSSKWNSIKVNCTRVTDFWLPWKSEKVESIFQFSSKTRLNSEKRLGSFYHFQTKGHFENTRSKCFKTFKFKNAIILQLYISPR